MMKKILSILVILVLLVSVVGCSNNKDITDTDPVGTLEGEYTGYSWKGEAEGVKFEDAEDYIETILELDKDGIIKDAEMKFFVKKDSDWTTRQNEEATVEVDFEVEPTMATPGDDYKKGNSMFTIDATDMMSFYAVAVNEEGVAAVAITDPVTRYMMEMKLPNGFDYTKPVSELTIGNIIIPTVRTSGGGIEKPAEWDSYGDKTIFNISPWSHVITQNGVLKGITGESSAQDLLEAFGVEFEAGQPKQMDVIYGYHSMGGWAGNYSAIEESLIGKNANELTSLIDWSNSRYSENIDENNFFGLDSVSGATRTVQNSIDGISGATVRMSRESTSYQRALVEAGIIKEADVIKGRF